MNRISNIIACGRAELPREFLACWASVFFSACVLTLLLSIAATQAFLALASVLYFAHLLRRKPEIGFPPVKLPLAIFCLWTVIATICAATPAAGGFEIRKLSLFLFLPLTVNLIVSAKHLRFLLKGVFVESAVAGILAADQFVKRYLTVRLQFPRRIYAHMTVLRIHGFMGHWMNFGGQQMLVFAMLLSFLLLSKQWTPGPVPTRGPTGSQNKMEVAQESIAARSAALPPRRWPMLFWWTLMGIIVVSIVLNLTRGIWLGCFVAAIYLIARRRARWLLALPVLLAVLMLAGPRLMRLRLQSLLHPSRDVSVAIRFQMWRVGWRMIKKHPLAGVGPNNIYEVYDLYLPPCMVPIVGYHEHLHNDYIQLAAARGLPCLAAWLWFMVALGCGCLRVARRRTPLSWVAHGALAGWLGLLVEGCFEFNFGTSPVLMVFLFVVAAPFAVTREPSFNPAFPSRL
ncbi:MAG TPA: O-antigen ligase family protein [Terriglobia bacterium]|nr:O-antigen ligase family protein [Terriglobia bacterium]